MRIEELNPSQSITFFVIAGDQKLEFPSTVLETYPRKRMIIAEPILKNNKIVSFSGEGVQVHLIANFTDQRPHIFQNIKILTSKNSDDSFCYVITCASESKEYNRRGAFRCFVGLSTMVRVSSEKDALEAIIKDVSVTGFAFTLSALDDELPVGATVHMVLNDFIEETGKNYSYQLMGNIVRSYSLESGKKVYGCQMTNRVIGLDRYLNEKERIRIQKNRTTTATPLRKK